MEGKNTKGLIPCGEGCGRGFGCFVWGCSCKCHEDAPGSRRGPETSDPSHPTPETPGRPLSGAGNEVQMGCTTEEDYVKLKIEFEKAKSDHLKEIDRWRRLLADCTDSLNKAHLESAKLGDRVGQLQAALDASVMGDRARFLEWQVEELCADLRASHAENARLNKQIELLQPQVDEQPMAEDEDGDLQTDIDDDDDDASDIEQMASRIRELEAAIVRLVLERL